MSDGSLAGRDNAIKRIRTKVGELAFSTTCGGFVFDKKKNIYEFENLPFGTSVTWDLKDDVCDS